MMFSKRYLELTSLFSVQVLLQQAPPLQRALDHQLEFVRIERLGQVVEGARASSTRTAVSICDSPVTMMTSMSGCVSFTLRSTSRPSIFGIMMSRMITS